MPESDLYSFSHKELISELIKASGVHEGRWVLALQVNITQGAFGSAPPGSPGSAAEAKPGVLVTINKIGIQRVPADAPTPLVGAVVNAEEVNPATKETPHLA